MLAAVKMASIKSGLSRLKYTADSPVTPQTTNANKFNFRRGFTLTGWMKVTGANVIAAVNKINIKENVGEGETTNNANTTMFQQTGNPLKP